MEALEQKTKAGEGFARLIRRDFLAFVFETELCELCAIGISYLHRYRARRDRRR